MNLVYGGLTLQDLWHELRHQIDNQQRSYASEAELRLTGLMASPSSEVAYSKLGIYLLESQRLRKANHLADALVAILVGAEYFWRKHRLTRAAGLLLEASDLFYLLDNRGTSQQCLFAALQFSIEGQPTLWWEFEIMANAVLLTACLSLIEDPTTLTEQLRTFREAIPERIRRRIVREDAYRVVTILSRAARLRNLTPVNTSETMPTRRSSSEFTTLHEYLIGHAERYAIIRDAFAALQHLTQGEE